MEKLVFRRSEIGYWQDSCRGKSIVFLAAFLHELRGYTLGVKRWIIDPQDILFDMEFCAVRKEGNFIIIAVKDENESIANVYDAFKIEKDNFVQLLDCWRELPRKYPQYIIFEYDGDYCFVYAENFPVPEQSVFDPIFWPAQLNSNVDIIFTMHRTAEGFYPWNEILFSSESILGEFIHGDLSWHGIDYFRQWLLDANQIHFSGDTSLLLKKGSYIVIKHFYYFKNIQEQLVLTREQFAKMLDDWEQMLKDKPENVRVHCKNGDVTFEWIK